MNREFIQSIKYLFFRFLLRRQFLLGKENRFGLKFKFKIEDVVGRRIFKLGKYERDISDFVANNIEFKDGDIALDIGANIGWYSILLNTLMPESGQIYAFEPDPLNFSLLSENILLNKAGNIHAVNKAISDKKESKKLYLYSNRNLGRHSLLESEQGDGVDVEAVQLDQYLLESHVDLSRVKFAKVDIEGYEFYALSGATKVLDYIECLVCEFVPDRMRQGGVDPQDLINLLENKGFYPSIHKAGQLCSVTSAELLNGPACDIVWLKR